MDIVTASARVKSTDEVLRRHLREVMERHKLPSLPVVVTKVLGVLKEPDYSVRQLSRIISDDTALAAKILAVSRSARYAQRHQPRTVHEAILVLGFHALRNVVMATAAQSFLARKSKVSEKLWSHSLAAALAARILAKRCGFWDLELAFLAGLLHDVGEIVLLHGDPRGFEQIVEEVQQSKVPLIVKEKESYVFDHTSIGLALLDVWDIDSRISEAVLGHHNEDDIADPATLAGILRMSDYLCSAADLGFFADAAVPAARLVRAFGCESADSLAQLVLEVRAAFEEESLLFRPS